MDTIWDSPLREVGAKAAAPYYLPRYVNGFQVLVPIAAQQGLHKWRVDNTELRAATAGLGFRNTKLLTDYVGDGVLVLADWGSTLQGTAEGEWVKVPVLGAQA